MSWSKLLSQGCFDLMFVEFLGRLNILVGLLGDLFVSFVRVCVFYVVIFPFWLF